MTSLLKTQIHVPYYLKAFAPYSALLRKIIALITETTHKLAMEVFYEKNQQIRDRVTYFWIALKRTLGHKSISLRKAYVNSHEEQLSFFTLITVRNIVAITALQHYSFTTILFPAVTAFACLLFIVMVIYRRRLLRSHS